MYEDVLMQQAGPLDQLPLPWVYAVISLVALVAVELGFRLAGNRLRRSATRRSPAILALVLTFSAVILLIADLDRPYEGLLTVSQQALLDLRDSIGHDNL
jgi:hypothetical protein